VNKRFHAFKDSLSNTKLAWFVSLQSKEAGAWLEAIPKFEKLTMDSNTFRLCTTPKSPDPRWVGI
jgi:hypothetical protein